MTYDIELPADVESLLIRFRRTLPPIPFPTRGQMGIDVSRWQGVIDWDAVKAAGIHYAGIRSSTGTSPDPEFARNWRECKRVGIPRMAYHYYINGGEPMAQLENYLRLLDNDWGELPFVLDIEPRVISNNPTVYETINKVANTDAIRAYLLELRARTGRTCAIYGSAWSLGMCTTYPTGPIMGWIGEYPLWIAQYTSAPAPTVPAPWTRYMCWQYTSTGRMAGISGNVDLNRWGELP